MCVESCLIVFPLVLSRGLPPWLIVLAGADRYLCSCASIKKRAWSSIRVANRLIPLTVLLSIIAYIHVPIFFNITIIPATQKPICYPPGPPGTYRIVLSFFSLIYFGLSPSLCMLLFSILTFRNITRSKKISLRSSMNVENAANRNIRKTDRQLLRMLFVQVLVYFVTATAYSIGEIVSSISAIQPENVVRVAQDILSTAIVGMMSNTGPCLSFYLFTLSSGLFRKQLKKLFCRTNRVDVIQLQPIQRQPPNTSRF